MNTLQAVASIKDTNTVWITTVLVQVLLTLARQHAHMIKSVTTLAANQDIANTLRIARVVILTQDFQQ